MAFETLLSDLADGILTVTLNRPDRLNAFNDQMKKDLLEVYDLADTDDEVRVVIVTGAGRGFCAGADLSSGTETFVSPDSPSTSPGSRSREAPRDGGGCVTLRTFECRKPVIAAIAGPAVAGGLELALWCDLRVADETAVFGVFCRRWGVPLIDGGTVRLPRLVGLSHAMDLILTGRPVDAPEALSIGLVNRVVPKGQALSAARSLAQSIASFPQQCMLADRESAYQGMSNSFDEALKYEFMQGLKVLAEESIPGAKRFSAGAGRRGRFDDYRTDSGVLADTDTQGEDT